MERVGIRELKEQASEIVRQVREAGIAYEITYHGRVVAHFTPVESADTGLSIEEWLAQVDASRKNRAPQHRA